MQAFRKRYNDPSVLQTSIEQRQKRDQFASTLSTCNFEVAYKAEEPSMGSRFVVLENRRLQTSNHWFTRSVFFANNIERRFSHVESLLRVLGG